MPETTRSDSLPPLLCTEEVAELLHVNRRTVLAMVRDGRLPARRIPGSRRFQFLSAEVMNVARRTDIRADRGRQAQSDESARDVDPCDVWGAAPSPAPGRDWAQECLTRWTELANRAGLDVEATEVYPVRLPGSERHAVGWLLVDGLRYCILAGPRRRVRLVNDDGETTWGLIDAVWAEPSA